MKGNGMTMKHRNFMLIFFVFLSMASFSLSSYSTDVYAMTNEPADFRGLRWTTNIRELSDLQPMAAEGEMKFFERKNDNLSIGDAKASKIVYGFYKDSLYSVFVYFDGLINFDKLKKIFIQKHGEAYQPNEYLNRYSWNGNTVDILLTYDDILKNGRIVYFHKPTLTIIENDETSSAQKGAGDL
jgi:hypothetical protein